MKIFQFTSTLLIFFLLAICIAAFLPQAVPIASAMSSKKPWVPCVNPSRIKLGSKIFSFPRPGPVAPAFIEPGDVSDLCHASSALEVTDWSARALHSALISDLQGKTDERGEPLAQKYLWISAAQSTPEMYADFNTLSRDVEHLLRTLKINIKDLPFENGFYVWRKSERPIYSYNTPPIKGGNITLSMKDILAGQNVYISDDPDLRPFGGELAVIGCRQHLEGERLCRAHLWDGEIKYTMWNFSPETLPKEHWKDLYLGFIKLRKELLLENGAKKQSKGSE